MKIGVISQRETATNMIKIGTSGFSFPDWVGTIYPAKLKRGDL